MRIAFRTDSSIDIGVGHVMRCLTLADSLQLNDADILFITRQHQGNINNLILEKGYKVYGLPSNTTNMSTQSNNKEQNPYSEWLGVPWQEDAKQTKKILSEFEPELLIVDHYAINYKWELEVNSSCNYLMVIDDLADRKHSCDILLDQTHGRSSIDYQLIVPKDCLLLLGSEYALLRAEFLQWREQSLESRINPELNQLIISLGGSDKDNITGQIIEALSECILPAELNIIIVMGFNAPHIDNVLQLVKNLPCNTQILQNISNMAELMSNSDLAIGAAGTTSWERCCLGLPTLLIVMADNQRKIADTLERCGAGIMIPNPVKKNLKNIMSGLTNKVMNTLSLNSSELIDGSGTERVVSKIQAL